MLEGKKNLTRAWRRREKRYEFGVREQEASQRIENVDGLWCSKEIAEKYFKNRVLKWEKLKNPAIKIQLGFMKKSLGIDCDKYFFCQVNVLKVNLEQTISFTCANDYYSALTSKVQNFSLPIVI